MENNKLALKPRHSDPTLYISLLAAGLIGLILIIINPVYALVAVLVFSTAAFGLMHPELLAWLGLLSVAISPQYMTSIQPFGLELSSFHKLIILFSLLPYILKYGFRKSVNPILVAYVIVLVLTFTFSSPPLVLGKVQPFKSFIGLTIGWFIYSLNWQPRFANKHIKSIAFLPIISVAAGAVLHILDIHALFAVEYTGAFRLRGANISAHLAMLAFMGIAVAMGEVARGQKKLLWVGLINFAILVATGTRGASLGAVLLFFPYGIYQFNRLLRGKIARHIVVILILAGAMVLIALPNFITRFQGNTYEQGINTSGRLVAWSFFYDQANQNPLFGRGMGAGTVLNQGQIPSTFRVPHNEFLRMYVDGGLVGIFVVLLGFGVVFLKHLKLSRSKFRLFFIFFIAGFLVYSFFDNTLSTTQFSVPLGWYMGLLYIKDRGNNNKTNYMEEKNRNE